MIDVILWAVAVAVVLIAIAAVFAIPVGVILLAEQAVRAVQALLAWRRARCARPGPDAIEALAATVLCMACRRGSGTCTCAIPCGEPGCVAGFSPGDVEFMRSLTMPEGTGQ